METDKFRFKIYVSIFVFILTMGIIGFIYFENLSLTDAIYFSIVTMATVGYGDIHPLSGIGKILAIILIIGGVGTFLGVVASITDIFVNRREEAIRHNKLNMVTGLFFSELGNELLKQLVLLDPGISEIQDLLKISSKWEDWNFDKASARLNHHRFKIDSQRGDISAFKEYLQTRTELLLRLIENPAIQEHEHFAELLRAIFHFRDELLNRSELNDLPVPDRRHLEGDMVRVYKLLVSEWLRYMQHLKKSYGYLFSLALRINPFDPEASATVKEA